MKDIEYIIVSDDDGHYYVIPSEKGNEWSEWVVSGNWELPIWCKSIGGALSLVKFKNYRIEG